MDNIAIPVAEIRQDAGDNVPYYHTAVRENYLIVHEDHVLWIKDGLVFRKLMYRKEETIRSALLTQFREPGQRTDSKTTTRAACVVFLTDTAYIYFEDGSFFTTNVPFTVKRALACERGVIIERDISADLNDGGKMSITKFFSMADPILDIGLVVSSSTSAISPNEELLYFSDSPHSSICLTYNQQEGTVNVYHSRFLAYNKARPENYNRRSSTRRRSSSIGGSARNDDSNNGSDGDISSSLEQRLSFSRTEHTGALDRMGNLELTGASVDSTTGAPTLDSVGSAGFDVSSLRKDVILTLLDSIPMHSTSMDALKMQSLIRQNETAVAILNKAENQVTILCLTRSSGPVGTPTIDTSYTFPACDIALVSPLQGDEESLLCILTASGQMALYNPFLNIQSPPLALSMEYQVVSIECGYSNVVQVRDSNGNRHQIEILLDTTETLSFRFFRSLNMLFDTLSVEHIKFMWLCALNMDPARNQRVSLFAVLCSCVLTFTDSSPWEFSSISELELLDKALVIAKRLSQSEIGSQFDFDGIRQYFILTLHVLREDLKLDIHCGTQVHDSGLFLSLFARASGWDENWVSYYEVDPPMIEGIEVDCNQPLDAPPNILRTLCSCFSPPVQPFVSLAELTGATQELERTIHPRIVFCMELFKQICQGASAQELIGLIQENGFDQAKLESLPEAIRVVVYESVEGLHFRDTSVIATNYGANDAPITSAKHAREIRSILHDTSEQDSSNPWDGQSEADKISITRLIFSEDRRFYEVSKLLLSSRVQSATLVPGADWTEHDLLNKQQELLKACALRAFSISFGRGGLFYSSRVPLDTEKYVIPKINFTLMIHPGGTTLSPQKLTLSEDSISWGYFHNGVSAGLSVSRTAKHISGSWIVFNKPSTLSSQHAGFLLGLGINGHLDKLEEWHIYNYLGPKHTQTSIALLIGMAASKIGTKDTKLTKVLSVHVAALLPIGSNDLNVSGLVQTAGLMGLGLLYYDTQHRRMTEILLSELGYDKPPPRSSHPHHQESGSATADRGVRDEGYRLAAGMALGLINLGHGPDLRGSNDMNITEKLLELAVGVRDVQKSPLLDTATAGAIIAISFLYMKTNDKSIVRKLDLGPLKHQLDYVRPDFWLLRVVGQNLICWDDIQNTVEWVEGKISASIGKPQSDAFDFRPLDSDYMGHYLVIGGLCFSIGLKHASTGDKKAKETVLWYLDELIRVSDIATSNSDEASTKRTVLNMVSLVSLSLALIMAGTGDLDTFRRLRKQYARTKRDTPFGSFLANQLAMGILFLGGGQYAFNTDRFSIACLVIAFYPLFPSSIHDNRAYLQAFRHLWVLAVDDRCLVVRHEHTGRPLNVDVDIQLNDGPMLRRTAPCLVPPLSQIKAITTVSDSYSLARLDGATQLQSGSDLTMHVSPIAVIDSALPYVELSLRCELDTTQDQKSSVRRLLSLSVFDNLDKIERQTVIPNSAEFINKQYLLSTAFDVRNYLESIARDPKGNDNLWALSLLFAFAEKYKPGHEFVYLSKPSIDKLQVLLWKAQATS